MRTMTLAAALIAVSTFAATSASAQIAPGKGPIDISADHQTADNAQRTTTYRGKVEVLQGQDRMRADQLVFFFKSGGAKGGGGASAGGNAAAAAGIGDIDRMEATGNVYFVTPTEVIRGDKAVYTQADDTIVVTGDVVATQGENVAKGSRLIVHVAAGTSEMVGEPGTGRVRTVVYPNKKQNPGQ